MGPLLLALCLLAPRPGGSPIEASGGTRSTHAISTRSDVLRLCKSLEFPERRRDARLDRAAAEADQVERRARALEARYAAELSGRGLSFDYDGAQGVLTLNERTQLTGAGGALRLWAVDGAELALPAEPGVARRIVAAARNGEGRLRLLFVLPEDDDEAICAHAPGTQSWGLGMEPVSWAFLVGGEVLAQGGTDEPVEPGAKGLATGQPAVEVGTPPSSSGAAVRQAIRGREAALLACYQKGLASRPGLDGVLVLELELSPSGGRGRSARVAMDSLHAPAVATCVLEALEKVELPKGSGPVQLPLHFRRDGAPAP